MCISKFEEQQMGASKCAEYNVPCPSSPRTLPPAYITSFSSSFIVLLLGPKRLLCCTPSLAALLDPALQPAEGRELGPPVAEPTPGIESELELDTEIIVGLLAPADELSKLLLASNAA